ncbi:MAG: hypothetical protein CMA10_07720 [Euryarchaeota archaeon]|nr:hypothetical protein [Euryarchaeota archaeon]
MGASASRRRPSSGRDAGWLVGADLFAVGLAFIGQIVLTHALLAEHYGWMVLAIDLFASFFLIIDLGLPTLLARDGGRAPELVPEAIWRIYRLQLIVCIPFIALAILLNPAEWINLNPPSLVMLFAGLIALVHVASYAPRSGLRVLGEARMEAVTKVVERLITTLGYLALYFIGTTSVVAFTFVFFVGASIGWLLALALVMFRAPASTGHEDWTSLDPSWASNKSLLYAALPFAITLGVLPYVVRIEKFMLAGSQGSEVAAVFHVAQLAWLAGLVVPAAMRAALLPVLGASRGDPVLHHYEMEKAADMSFGLLPIGLFGGALIVAIFAPIAFPSEYLDTTYGASAVDLFFVLLFGWAMTLMATPTYTALMAGENSWKFTQFIGLVLAAAVVLGWLFILVMPSNATQRLYGAALASSLSGTILLFISWAMSGSFQHVRQRSVDWGLMMLFTTFAVVGFVTHTLWWVFGLPLFMFVPRGWRAMRSTLR